MINLLEVGDAFNLFGMTVKWYGIIIATGVLVAVLVACYNAKIKNYSKDFPYEILLWCFPLAIIGARLYYIIFSGESYTFLEAIAIWNGGMAIYGGIIGGLLGIILYAIIRNHNILKITDLVAPSLIIAQSIGRWGNFANQEVFGTVVSNPDWQWFPFAVYIDRLEEWHYATFFYESMICLIGFILLMFIFRKTKSYGVTTGVYLIFYGVERFFLEGLREKSEILFIGNSNIPVSQVVSILFMLAGVILLTTLFIIDYKKKKAKISQDLDKMGVLQNTENIQNDSLEKVQAFDTLNESNSQDNQSKFENKNFENVDIDSKEDKKIKDETKIDDKENKNTSKKRTKKDNKPNKQKIMNN